MKYIIFISLILTGCQTTPTVKLVLPPVDENMLIKCPPLITIASPITLSEIIKSVVQNYTIGNKCAAQNDAWIEWYHKNSNIIQEKTN